eukprot:15314-Heterococcus_DN1.PRE.1
MNWWLCAAVTAVCALGSFPLCACYMHGGIAARTVAATSLRARCHTSSSGSSSSSSSNTLSSCCSFTHRACLLSRPLKLQQSHNSRQQLAAAATPTMSAARSLRDTVHRAITAVLLAVAAFTADSSNQHQLLHPPAAYAERMPLSEYRSRSMDELTGVEPGRVPDLSSAYKRLIETTVAEGGADDDELLFAEEDETSQGFNSAQNEEEAGVNFGSGEWMERSTESMAETLESETPAAETAGVTVAAAKTTAGEGSSTAATATTAAGSSTTKSQLDALLAGYTESVRAETVRTLGVTSASASELPETAAPAAKVTVKPATVRPETAAAAAETVATETAKAVTPKAETHSNSWHGRHFPGAQSLDYQRELSVQKVYEQGVQKLTENGAAAHHEGRLVPPDPDSFEAEAEAPWHYEPNLPDFEYLLPRLAVVTGISLVITLYQWQLARKASADQLPLEYDVDMIEHYFGLRPDRVLARTLEIATECSILAAGSVFDLLLKVFLRKDSATRAQMEVYRAAELRECITRLGPAFIKLGQALASRPDLVSEGTMAELAALQDALPFYPNAVARELIRKELGAYPERVFDWMSTDPVAAASLGQVYKARAGGVSVAVKVQRPGLVAKIALDCYVLRGIAAGASVITRFPGLRFRSDFVSVVDEYASRLFEELDYSTEAKNMKKFKQLYGDLEGIYIPKVYEQYSGKSVITTEWIDGTKVVNERAKVSPQDMPLLQVGIQCTLMQLLDKGVAHCDPH